MGPIGRLTMAPAIWLASQLETTAPSQGLPESPPLPRPHSQRYIPVAPATPAQDGFCPHAAKGRQALPIFGQFHPATQASTPFASQVCFFSDPLTKQMCCPPPKRPFCQARRSPPNQLDQAAGASHPHHEDLWSAPWRQPPPPWQPKAASTKLLQASPKPWR